MSTLNLSGSMRLIFKLAARNLRRDLRRTLIAASAVSLGLGLFIFSDHLQQGTYQSLIHIGVSTQAGHLVVQSTGYQEDPDQEVYINNAHDLGASLLAPLKEAQVDVKLATRAKLMGVLQSAAGSARAQLLAIDPIAETQVSDWHKRLIPAPLPKGEDGDALPSAWLKSEDQRGILLGAKLAQRLDLTVGDKLVYTYQHQDEVESLLFRVRGILRLNSEDQEANTAIITLAGASAALKSPHSAHQLTFHLKDLRDLERAHSILNDQLTRSPTQDTMTSGVHNHKASLSLLRWQEALPAIHQFSIKDRQSAQFIFLIMGIIIAIGVLNTIAMSALERQRHFGVMMALGLTPRLIGGLLVFEGMILGIVASLIGLALGVLISWPAVEYGIDMSSMMGEGMDIGGVYIDTRVYAVWHLEGLIQMTSASMILCVLASLYPARRTAKLSALTAMRGPEASPHEA
jgi:ABC-type lipoprotein release transport system permease subunit